MTLISHKYKKYKSLAENNNTESEINSTRLNNNGQETTCCDEAKGVEATCCGKEAPPQKHEESRG